jgi:hypothetical protein
VSALESEPNRPQTRRGQLGFPLEADEHIPRWNQANAEKIQLESLIITQALLFISGTSSHQAWIGRFDRHARHAHLGGGEKRPSGREARASVLYRPPGNSPLHQRQRSWPGSLSESIGNQSELPFNVARSGMHLLARYSHMRQMTLPWRRQRLHHGNERQDLYESSTVRRLSE